jgi:hypothetical protein
MSKYYIALMINAKNKIDIKFEDPIEKVHCCYEIPI